MTSYSSEPYNEMASHPKRIGWFRMVQIRNSSFKNKVMFAIEWERLTVCVRWCASNVDLFRQTFWQKLHSKPSEFLEETAGLRLAIWDGLDIVLLVGGISISNYRKLEWPETWNDHRNGLNDRRRPLCTSRLMLKTWTSKSLLFFNWNFQRRPFQPSDFKWLQVLSRVKSWKNFRKNFRVAIHWCQQVVCFISLLGLY